MFLTVYLIAVFALLGLFLGWNDIKSYRRFLKSDRNTQENCIAAARMKLATRRMERGLSTWVMWTVVLFGVTVLSAQLGVFYISSLFGVYAAATLASTIREYFTIRTARHNDVVATVNEVMA